MMLVVGYYTRGNGYDVEAAALRRSLDALSIPYDIRAYNPFADWQHATQFKARFLRIMAREYADRPLIWLDADSRVERDPRPYLANLDCDFAAHYLDDTELISATLYLPATGLRMTLLDAWVDQCRMRPTAWDQRCLQIAVDMVPGLRVRRLPPQYNWIDAQDPLRTVDISERMYGPVGDVVIRQTQASRRLKAGAGRGRDG